MKTTLRSLFGYPPELCETFSLQDRLKDVDLGVPLDLVVSLRYGGTQFGYYTDLGDKRTAVIRDLGPRGVYLVKGGFTTPLCDYGTGVYKNADSEEYFSYRLLNLGIPTQKVIKKANNGNGYTSILWRPTPYRFGTIEYADRHCPWIIPKIWAETTTRLARPDVTAKDLWEYIHSGYLYLAKFWKDVGFVHGCLNTDNLCLLPYGIDYGHSYFTSEGEHDLDFDPYGRYKAEAQAEIIEESLENLKSLLQQHIDL